MQVIAIANQKGGVGKTTTSINLATGIALKNKRVLLLDFDPQANATSGIGVENESEFSAYNALVDGTPLKELTVKTRFKHLDVIPSAMDLAGVEIELAGQVDQITKLRQMFQELKKEELYDYCIIDTPPSLGILMTSALTAADEVLIPLQCEWFGLEGLAKIVQIIERIKDSGSNPDLFIGGILMTMFDSRTNLSKSVVQEVKNFFPDELYKTIIPRSVRISEAPSHGLTIFEHERSGLGAKAYENATKEFLRKHSIK